MRLSVVLGLALAGLAGAQKECPAGKYSESFGSSKCIECERGTYAKHTVDL